MANQTTISSNGQSASQLAAESIGGLAHDVIALVELQVKLATCDLRAMSRGLVLPIILAVVVLLLLLGTIFTSFITAGYALVEGAGWSHTASFATSAAAGLVLALFLGLVAWARIRGSLHKLDRSQQELIQNLQALKAMLKDHEQRPLR